MPHRLCLLCLTLPWVAACSLLAPEPEQAAIEPAPAEEAAPPELERSEEAPLIARRPVEEDIQQLLDAAEAAMAADRLTTPVHDNAFDRYQAVLLLRPENQQARTGLQQVFARYMAMVRTALARNRPGTARALLERAKLVDRNHPLLAELEADIDALQKRLAEQAGQSGEGEGSREVLLDAATLDRREQSVIDQLHELASEVRDSEETLLIVARSDAEGRWIYQRMSEGVPDYRLRGDIRLGREPKILLLPPIE